MADFREMTGCLEYASRPWTGRRPWHFISPGGAGSAAYAVARPSDDCGEKAMTETPIAELVRHEVIMAAWTAP